MKAKQIPILHDIEYDNDLVVGKKFNGWAERLIIKNGSVRMLNKSGSEQTLNVPHITALRVPMSMDLVIIGEGYARSGRVEDAKSIFGSGPVHSLEWQKVHGNALFTAVDIMVTDGQDLSQIRFGERRIELAKKVGQLITQLMFPIQLETLISGHKYQYFEDIISLGGEGVVVKSLLGDESDWYKVKKVRDYDVVITGFTEANEGKTGKFKGLIGAITYGCYVDGKMKEIGKVSGMVDAQRIEFTNNRAKYIGKVIEISGQEIGNGGAVVFPRFVRIREDKLPSECALPGRD